MLDFIISLIAPHSCVSCQKRGYILCDECMANLIEERSEMCIGCGTFDMNGLCVMCRDSWLVESAAVFGERSGIVKALIDEYKFSHKRAAAAVLAELMSELLPHGNRSLLVPIPTVARHVRQRGYDHMILLTRKVARMNRLAYAPLLRRQGTTVQHGASRQDRLSQADVAFTVNEPLSADTTYIVLDDITTTGASLRAAARVLQAAGARHVWTVALARQPLEEPLDERG